MNIVDSLPLAPDEAAQSGETRVGDVRAGQIEPDEGSFEAVEEAEIIFDKRGWFQTEADFNGGRVLSESLRRPPPRADRADR